MDNKTVFEKPRQEMDAAGEAKLQDNAATTFNMVQFIADNLHLMLWEYHVPERRIIINRQDEALSKIPAVLEQIPQSLLAYVDERSIADVLRLYQDIDDGCLYTACDVWYTKSVSPSPRCDRVFYTVVQDEQGKALKAYGMAQNITDSSQLQQKHFAEVQRVLQREQEAVNAKSEFLSNISHDMRTPLNGIMGFTRLALESEDVSIIKQYLQKIRVSGSLLLDLVNDTLLLSKLASGILEPHYEIIDNRTISTRVVIPVSAAAAQKNIEFIVNREKSPQVLLWVDRINTQKIFLNLLSNAVKFTPEGGRVEIHMEQLAEPVYNCNYRFVVKDTGIGISEAFLGKIYDPFVQEHALETEHGTGLGLAIVKQLVDLLHGHIEVCSEKGKGTEFTVYLPMPIVTGEMAEEAARKSARSIAPDVWLPMETTDEMAVQPAETGLPPLQSKRILLCEDNYLNTEIARNLLHSQGYTVVCATNGQEGIDVFADSRPGDFAAILMDLRMPVMNGHDAAAFIRGMDRQDAQTIPIIALSADAFEDDMNVSRKLGMNAHLVKPVDPSKLFSVLKSFTEK